MEWDGMGWDAKRIGCFERRQTVGDRAVNLPEGLRVTPTDCNYDGKVLIITDKFMFT